MFKRFAAQPFRNAVTSNFRFNAEQQMRMQSSATAGKNPLFDKILIANRGEIACRVMRTAKKLGIRTVAVYSEADRNSMHTKMADEAYLIGEAESSKSYLRAEKIIEVAKRSGAQAVHPGYGFLSENTKFAQLCKDNGIVFIGPPSPAIRAMGSKSESKRIMEKANVPVVPGYHGDNQDEAFLLEESKKIGFPVLIKAVSGGGGKGMRIVREEKEFFDALHSAKREAMASFADDNVIIEKYITKPRHIEFQVFGDQLGHYVYLFERDCSVQRRHQKVIEEAPAPDMSEELRARMGKTAVEAARAVGYFNAGTVEFIVDADNPNNFYFMEMNTRLQVEHPVTEMITGQDLVEWQLHVASGNPLPIKDQSQLKINGHCFETRIYAENPDGGFLPGTGTLKYLRTPKEEVDSVRVETGVREGDEVSIYYDPMIAKLVVWGEDRSVALRKLKSCLDQYHIAGLATNIDFLKRLSLHPEFRKGNVETHFIQKHFDSLFPKDRVIDDAFYVLGALGVVLKQRAKVQTQQLNNTLGDPFSPFGTLSASRLGHEYVSTVKFEGAENTTIDVNIRFNADGTYTLRHAGKEFNVAKASLIGDNHIIAFVNDQKHETDIVIDGKQVSLFTQSVQDGRSLVLNLKQSVIAGAGAAEASANTLQSPMPGKVTKLLCEIGQKVEKGQPLIVVEAMKMEHTISAPRSTVVKEICRVEGQTVGNNEVLIILE